MPNRYRKLPVTIEAIQWTGDNIAEIWAWVGADIVYDRDPDLLYIETLEGRMRADLGDWIIRGVKGEFYPCKPDIFAATYESAGTPLEQAIEVIARQVVHHYSPDGADWGDYPEIGEHDWERIWARADELVKPPPDDEIRSALELFKARCSDA